MKLTIDLENTVQKLPDGKLLLDPFTEGNALVLVCAKEDTGEEHSFWFNHTEVVSPNDHTALQELLDRATVLICHNAQHELIWLWECGFNYDGPVFDTMLVDYVLQRGVKQPLSLEAVAERYQQSNQKMSTLTEYLGKGISVDAIPKDELLQYCMQDVRTTQELASNLRRKMFEEQYGSFEPILQLTNEMCVLLTRIYQRGFTVDRAALEQVREEFTNERDTIVKELELQVHKLMGDTPINLSSPEQLSMVIYSRKPKDKSTWPTHFSRYMKKPEVDAAVKANSDLVYQTSMFQCKACFGHGYTIARKKDGSLGKAKRKCKECDTKGVVFVDTQKVAGLKFNVRSASFVAAHGFKTDKKTLTYLEKIAMSNNMHEAVDFLSKVRRLSALDTYISAFVDGINTFTKSDKRLHVRMTQHRTSTGRLASDSPNLHNMPRGNTFPIKRVFVSRWDGGSVIEADFAQLEFRVAAQLSGDETATDEINNNFDVHSYTASVITEAGQPVTRQQAKEHTFAPLFGATGFGRTPAEARYYENFLVKYRGIAQWHGSLAKEVMQKGYVTTPSGRQFAFPDAKRLPSGGITGFTMVKNYPVQSAATDIVQTTLLLLEKNMRLRNLRSILVNSVHDNAVIDVYPQEEKAVLSVINDTVDTLPSEIYGRFNMKLHVPLEVETKVGKNWMEMQEMT